MDIHRVAFRDGVSPSCSDQAATADDPVHVGYELAGQPGLQIGKRHGLPLEDQQAGPVDNWHDRVVLSQPRVEIAHPGSDVAVRGRESNPILEEVGRTRRFCLRRDQQQARALSIGQSAPPFSLRGPMNQLDVHSAKLRHHCDAQVSAELIHSTRPAIAQWHIRRFHVGDPAL